MQSVSRPNRSGGAFERGASSEVAKCKGLDALRRLSLQPSFRRVGSQIETVECSLEQNGKSIALGFGKGFAGQETASAIFEALEHYFYQSENLAEHAIVRTLALHGQDSVLTKCSPDFALICGGASFPLTWCTFQPISEGHAPVQIPAFLFYPDFASTVNAENEALKSFRFLRYSTNSGTASGLTEAEASLHAILELIERDSVSIELLRTVMKKEPWPARRILPSTLPDLLTIACDLSCGETGLDPVLFDVTTDLRVPSVLCMLQPSSNEKGRAYFGSGTSLSPTYAAERAILEAVQNFHSHNCLGISMPEAAPNTVNPSVSRYHRCFLTAGIYAYLGGEITQSFEEITPPTDNVETLTPAEQLSYLAELLASYGYPCFHRVICDDLVQVRQVVIPGLEHFNLVSYGIPVAPGARGRAVLTQPTSPREDIL